MYYKSWMSDTFYKYNYGFNSFWGVGRTSCNHGGKPQKEKYKDFQKEMLMINKAFCEVMMEGDAQGRLFSYPIPTYNLTKDFDWDNPEYEPIWNMTAKYGIPYFSNFINSDMNPDDARSMCCRLRLDNRVLRKRGGGLFGANPLNRKCWCCNY